MSKPITWIIVDGNYLAHRAGFSTGAMAHETRPTGVIWGFLAEITRLRKEFANPQFVFAFDSKWNLRKQIDPAYKATRISADPELIAKKKVIHTQIAELYTDFLPRLGYDNILLQEGYEADDLIACTLDSLWPTGRNSIVIVSADQDLYQLLDANVVIYKLKPGERHEFFTRDDFRREFHDNRPNVWPSIKAVAGCKSDNIEGCKGAGERQASRYFAGQIPKRLAIYKTIDAYVNEGKSRYEKNLELVKLPYHGCKLKNNIYQNDEPSQKAWNSVCEELGFQAIPGVSKAEYMASQARKGMRRD